MSGWKTIKVCDIGKVITGNTPPRKKPELYGSHTIFIKPTDISEDSKYTLNPEECYSESGYKKFKKSLIPKGSTCVVTIGSIGKKITKAHCDCFINQAMNAVIPYSNYDEEFVYYLLKYNLVQLKTLDSGTASGRENVSKSSFSNIQVNVPINKTIQTKIGSILSAYDILIENNRKRIKLLEEIAHRTYEEWFVKFLINGEQLPIDRQTGLPVGWKMIQLENLINFQKGKKATDIVSEYKEGYLKLLLLDGIESGNYPYTNSNNQVIAERDDLLMLMDGARSSKVFFADMGVVGSTLSKISIKNKYLSSSLLKLFFDTNYELMQTNNTGAAIPHANKNFINSMLFPMPTKDVLIQWKEKIEIHYTLIRNIKSQNQKLKECRDVLLPRLMNGTIKVSES